MILSAIKTRTFHPPTLILMCIVWCNTLVLILQIIPSENRPPNACVVMGFFQHFFACATLSWYTLNAIHFFCLLVGNGKYEAGRFDSSLASKLVYCCVGFGFPIIDCAIVWGLLPIGYLYGPMPPWVFCWITTVDPNGGDTFLVLGVAFYLFALIAILMTLTLSIIIIVTILRVRAKLKKIDGETLYSVIALALTCNIGTIGFGLLGLFFFLKVCIYLCLKYYPKRSLR
jgi:hypothetical protein